MKELVAAGAKYLQIEDLGAWMPLFTGDKAYYTWIKDVIAQCCDGVNAKIGWHFCFGNAWGNDLISGAFPEGYQTVLPHFFDTPGINEFVLDYANRNMAGVEFLKNLPKDKSVQVGVLDVRSNAIESPQTIAARVKKVVAAVSPDRVVLSTDCGMKPLARMLPTTITGSLPRPSWYTENLGTRSFLDAMVTSRFREQYVDALSVYLREQEVAGLDIVTDGDCRFDQDIGGQSWTSYPPHHMTGFDNAHPKLAKVGAGGLAFPRGHILHDYLEARVMPKLVGPVGRGEMQYTEIWKAAQRLTTKPVKFGTVTPAVSY